MKPILVDISAPRVCVRVSARVCTRFGVVGFRTRTAVARGVVISGDAGPSPAVI